MSMKGFLITILIAALPLIDATACISEGNTYNRYMFSVFRHEAMTDGPAYLYDIDRFWQDYMGENGPIGVDYFKWNRDAILKTAKERNDEEMTAYINLLNRYFKACEDYARDAWSYPTKDDLAHRHKTFTDVLVAAKAYGGKALRPQYVLLQMRANMMLGNDNLNVALWKTSASSLPQSPWREAMRNIYARALLKTGQRGAACDISKGDNDAEWFKQIDAKQVYRKEAMAFVQFALNAANDSNVKLPSLWLAAASMIDYLFGNTERAMAEAEKAVVAEGSQRMRDNARAIRLLVSTRANKPTKEYTDYLLGEFRWLDNKIEEERGSSYSYSNHYTDVKERVVHRGLEQLFRRAGMDNTALALCAMMNADDKYFYMEQSKADLTIYSENQNVTYSPWNEYFCKMDSLTADRLADYYRYLSSSHDNAFDQYCVQNSYHDADYFNDLIGTKLIAEGRFAEAIPYLDGVSMSLLSSQLISAYSSQRRYDVPRWFGKQRVSECYDPVTVNRNIKLDYCRDMADRLNRYNLAREGAAKQQMAYDLAVRYYQASCYGDCWFLTHYYSSVMDSARSWEKDFAAETVKYLNVAKRSDDLQLRYRSVYALAFMPVDKWAEFEYDGKVILYPHSAQYEALYELSLFAMAYPNVVDQYTRRCDVLKRYEYYLP